MKYLATEKFIKALSEWNEITVNTQATDFSTLLFILNYRIGIKNNDILIEESIEKRLNSLEERIKYLIVNEKVNELFLISSLKNYVTFLFNHYMQIHGDSILFHEEMLNEHPEMKVSISVLEQLKSPNYLMRMKNDYFRWKEIISKELSEEQFESWERSSMLVDEEKTKYDMKKMEVKYGNMTMKEIIKEELKK